ncbi:MAG: hypothetical protein V2I51_15010 [Anderseniella sp.]|jgi:hypothetical protein|nr:hypothetical protein [Anderseniella sp.]
MAPQNDFEADLFASINYDSSRDFNLTWPISQGFAVYRHRLDQRNFLFIDQLVAVNDSTFSTQVFALATPVDSFGEVFLWSATRLDWPITKQWMWTNRLSLRYRSRPLEAGFKRLNVILSTGLT